MAEECQDQPDSPEPGIVPPYMLRRIEANRRYPPEDGPYPGVDRNERPRQAFIDGAEWEAERGRDTGNPG
jgi:hypothetical protein